MALPDCCAAAEKRLADAGLNNAHVKALREHTDGKHAGFKPAVDEAPAVTSLKK